MTLSRPEVFLRSQRRFIVIPGQIFISAPDDERHLAVLLLYRLDFFGRFSYQIMFEEGFGGPHAPSNAIGYDFPSHPGRTKGFQKGGLD
jgi:hypothetical protein